MFRYLKHFSADVAAFAVFSKEIGSRQIGNPTAFHPPRLGKALSVATLSTMTPRRLRAIVGSKKELELRYSCHGQSMSIPKVAESPA